MFWLLASFAELVKADGILECTQVGLTVAKTTQHCHQ
jgi:hypothetical protein